MDKRENRDDSGGGKQGGKRAELIAFAIVVAVAGGFLYLSNREKSTQTIIEKGGENVGSGEAAVFAAQFFDDEGNAWSGVTTNYVRIGECALPLRKLIKELGKGGRGKFEAPYNEYIPGGKPSGFPYGKTVRGEIRVLDIVPQKFVRMALQDTGDPEVLVVDVAGAGRVDKLGTDLGPNKGRRWTDVRNCRMFPMTGTGSKLWEWVGDGAGFLMIDQGTQLPKNVTGADLVGSHTGMQRWLGAYDVLWQLDLDGNGRLEGGEMERLSLWIDRNGNGECDEGEATKAGEVLESISAPNPSSISKNGGAPSGDARLKDGRVVGTWAFQPLCTEGL